MTVQKSCITIDSTDLPALAAALQKGFLMEINTGCSVRELLRTQWKLSDEYVARRISTLFIDGKPVDNLDTAVIEEGTTLALSCAMPGLVGAVMRRDGLLSSFRSGITYSHAAGNVVTLQGRIRVRLFNMLIRELGPGFLKDGIEVDVNDLTPGFRDKYAVRPHHRSEKIRIRLDI